MRKGSQLLKDELISLTLRLPKGVIEEIDGEIARRLEEAPGVILHRTDIARDFIVRSLRDRKERTDA
jgi:hypothetical protein